MRSVICVVEKRTFYFYFCFCYGHGCVQNLADFFVCLFPVETTSILSLLHRFCMFVHLYRIFIASFLCVCLFIYIVYLLCCFLDNEIQHLKCMTRPTTQTHCCCKSNSKSLLLKHNWDGHFYFGLSLWLPTRVLNCSKI